MNAETKKMVMEREKEQEKYEEECWELAKKFIPDADEKQLNAIRTCANREDRYKLVRRLSGVTKKQWVVYISLARANTNHRLPEEDHKMLVLLANEIITPHFLEKMREEHPERKFTIRYPGVAYNGTCPIHSVNIDVDEDGRCQEVFFMY